MALLLLAAATALGIPVLTAVIAGLTERPAKPEAERKLNQDTPAKAAWITFAIWAVLTAAGLAVVLTVDFYPKVGSDRGAHIADAFRFLTALAVPVGAMVLAVLAYSFFRRGSGEEPPEAGMAFDGRGPFPKLWLGATAGLTALMIVYPGLWTLDEVVHKHKDPDLVVDVQAMQWTWLINYPDLGIENQTELVLPVDRKITFNITSRDVLHSFWVPAFLMKIDAVPGLTTTLSLVAEDTGDYSEDSVYRLQCAELCGISHARMRVPVRVVSQSEFDTWVKEKTAAK
ncbi:MAG TPA: cytochrome c oxidase subunit II [Dehalococcoidia bacterium]|nr:cytochrome c oxidase subunit II [Dehalococcoidia bacterium]